MSLDGDLFMEYARHWKHGSDVFDNCYFKAYFNKITIILERKIYSIQHHTISLLYINILTKITHLWHRKNLDLNANNWISQVVSKSFHRNRQINKQRIRHKFDEGLQKR